MAFSDDGIKTTQKMKAPKVATSKHLKYMASSNATIGIGPNHQGIWPLDKPLKCLLTKCLLMIPIEHGQQSQSMDIHHKYLEKSVINSILPPSSEM